MQKSAFVLKMSRGPREAEGRSIIASRFNRQAHPTREWAVSWRLEVQERVSRDAPSGSSNLSRLEQVHRRQTRPGSLSSLLENFHGDALMLPHTSRTENRAKGFDYAANARIPQRAPTKANASFRMGQSTSAKNQGSREREAATSFLLFQNLLISEP
jgi:hypothetical protein